MFALPFVVLSLTTFSLTSPPIVGRHSDQTSLCPWNGVPDANNFTLLAVYKTDSNVQKPLALNSLSWIGSAESMDSRSIIARNFTMVDGGVTAYAPDSSIVGVSRQVPKEDGWLLFSRPENGMTVSPAKVYCKLFNTSPHGVKYPYALAVDGGDSDHFCLCQRCGGDEFVVVYNPVQSNSVSAGYNYNTCIGVAIYILPVDQE